MMTTPEAGPMDLPVRSHQPKGGMCATCVWVRRNCAGLNFEGMPVIERDDKTGAKIVRCTEHLRTEKPLQQATSRNNAMVSGPTTKDTK